MALAQVRRRERDFEPWRDALPGHAVDGNPPVGHLRRSEREVAIDPAGRKLAQLRTELQPAMIFRELRRERPHREEHAAYTAHDRHLVTRFAAHIDEIRRIVRCAALAADRAACLYLARRASTAEPRIV